MPSNFGSVKRKLKASTQPPRKKTKISGSTVTANDLPWKTVATPKEAGLGDFDGILELEEVDDVEVVYEETEGGRVPRFNVSLLVEWIG